MGASQFVGRVGGLAVALGVGAAVFSGSGVAWADFPDGADTGNSAGAATENTQSSPRRGDRGADRAEADSTPSTDSPPTDASDSDDELPVALIEPELMITEPGMPADPEVMAIEVEVPVEPDVPVEAFEPELPVLHPMVTVIVDPVLPEPQTFVLDGQPAEAPSDEVSGVISKVADPSDGAGEVPGAPFDMPLEWALLAYSRRETLGAPGAGVTPLALVTTSEAVTDNGITVDPTVEIVDGIIQGTLQASNTSGLPMTYTLVDSSNGGKIAFGTVPVSPTETDPQSYTILPYATWLDSGGAKGAEEFTVRVSEVTEFNTVLVNIPLIGMLAEPVIGTLQTLPLIGDLLAPLIGAGVLATIDIPVGELAPAATPVAFTYKVTSFDGTLISTNFFPAAGLATGDTAPTVLNQPGLGSAGPINPYAAAGTEPYTIGIAPLRQSGYNVITWDPRGCFDSGGVLQLDNPFFEGRDTSAIISWAAAETPAELNGPDDPKVGMVGGSYGGAIQLTTASIDPRIDAIVPGATWNSLNQALYPTEIFKTSWANALLLYLVRANADINNQVYSGVISGNLVGLISQTAQAVLASSGPTALLNQLKAPTLLIQGAIDALFPLQESVANAQTIVGNPYGTTVKMLWFCGGHGACLAGNDPKQYQNIYASTLAWLNTYVAGIGDPAADVPVFQWYDQYNNPALAGMPWTSTLLPFQAGFNQPTPYTVTDDGGQLDIKLFMAGGSGPLEAEGISWPASWTFATKADNAINVPVSPPVGQQIVGAPTLSFDYQGWGIARAVYVQLVDNKTGLVVGNVVTPVRVDLDGKPHTVAVPLSDIAYTVYQPDSMTLQITSAASMFANSAFGSLDISNIKLDMPLRNLV